MPQWLNGLDSKSSEGESPPRVRIPASPPNCSTCQRRPNFAGTGISGGVSRQVVPGDVIVIPGNTPHWFSSLDTDLRYLIIRPAPESLLEVR